MAAGDGPRQLQLRRRGDPRPRHAAGRAAAQRRRAQLYDGLSHVINEQINAMRASRASAAAAADGPRAANDDGSCRATSTRDVPRPAAAEQPAGERRARSWRARTASSAAQRRAQQGPAPRASRGAKLRRSGGGGDRERRLVDVNQAFTAITGFARADGVGHGPHAQRTDAAPARLHRRHLGSRWRARQLAGRMRGRRNRNGELFPEVVVGQRRARRQRRHRQHYVVKFSDITRLKHAEERWQRLAFYDSLTAAAQPRAVQGPSAAGAGARPRASRTTLGAAVHRPRRLQDRQRQPRPRGRRRAARARRPQRIAGLRARRRPGRPPRRRRVRRRAARARPATSTRSRSRGRMHEALAAPFRVAGRERHARCSVGIAVGTARRRRRRDDPARRRRRDVPGQGAGRKGRFEFFDAEHARRGRRAPRARDRPAPGARARRVRAPLPADGRPRDERHRRRRGADALAPPEPRLVLPGRVHPARRGDRPDRPIGDWVLREACRQTRDAGSAGSAPPLRRGVNLSVRQLARPGPADDVADALVDVAASTRRR